MLRHVAGQRSSYSDVVAPTARHTELLGRVSLYVFNLKYPDDSESICIRDPVVFLSLSPSRLLLTDMLDLSVLGGVLAGKVASGTAHSDKTVLSKH
jgi:hypothetical protein